MSNIGIVYSILPSKDPSLHKVGVVENTEKEKLIFVYEVPDRMGKAIVVPHPALGASQIAVTILDPRNSTYRVPTQLRDDDDVLVYLVDSRAPELFIVSQKYHSQWRAEVLVADTWVQTPLREVNGMFQGVTVGPGVSQVRLSFLPYVRWAWLGHLFWVIFGAVVAIRWVINKRKQAVTASAIGFDAISRR